jgi:ribosomal-protein-alanine N-acetyltransferase
MDEASARAIQEWRYEAPYDVYNEAFDSIEAGVAFLTDSCNGYYALVNECGELVAFCCFGLDAQVPGGDYEAEALDVGLGVRPDLTGHGHGLEFVNAVLGFAQQEFVFNAFRVTVAAFNERALRVWEKAGFRRQQTFGREPDGMSFVVLTRVAG